MLYFLSLWLGFSLAYYTVYKLKCTLFIQYFMVYLLVMLLRVVSDWKKKTCAKYQEQKAKSLAFRI